MMNDLLDIRVVKYLNTPATSFPFRFDTRHVKTFAALYLFYKAKQQGLPVLNPIEELLVRVETSDTIKEILYTYLAEYKDNNFSDIADISDRSILHLFKFSQFNRGGNYTSFQKRLFYSIILSILDVKPEDTVSVFYQNPIPLDYTIPDNYQNTSFYALANCKEDWDFLVLRQDLLNIQKQVNYLQADPKDKESPIPMQFSKIFAFPPVFQKRTNETLSRDRFMCNTERGDEDNTIFYIQRVLDSLQDGGRAVILVSNAFFNRNYADFHKEIITQKKLIGVIHLPPMIIMGSISLSSSLLVLEKGIDRSDSYEIKFIDTRSFENLGRKDWDIFCMSDELDLVKDWNRSHPRHGAFIPAKRIAENNYNLNFAFYEKELKKDIYYQTPSINLSDIEDSVTDFLMAADSGPAYSTNASNKSHFTLTQEAKIFKSIQDKTDIKFFDQNDSKAREAATGRYLRISDIQDNHIQDTMSYISTLGRDLREYELRPTDVLIAKVLPVKTVILSPLENQRIYPDGNFFIIRLKENSELSPAYLKGYLESKAGKQQLEKLASGGSMLAITKGALERLEIPYKTRTEQEKYIRKYNEYENQIQQLQQQIQKTKDKIEALLSSNDQNEED